MAELAAARTHRNHGHFAVKRNKRFQYQRNTADCLPGACDIRLLAQDELKLAVECLRAALDQYPGKTLSDARSSVAAN